MHYGVDAGSQDGTGDLLRQYLPPEATVVDAPGVWFGQGVQRVVDLLPPISGHQEAPSQHEWLWLLHDDSAPAPDALEQLLDEVEKSESVAMAGTKQIDAESRTRLLEAGLTMTRNGERFAGVGLDEVDQGQHDMHTDRLSVNTAGMLIRRDVFEDLGGFDPALPGVGDDVDLGRRVALAGHRVVVAPRAKVYHRTDVVEDVAGDNAQYAATRYSRMKFAAPLASFFVGLWMIVSGVGLAVGRLVAGDTHTAGLEARHAFTPLKRSGAIRRGRRSVAKTRAVPRSTVNRLLATRAQVQDHRRAVRDSLLMQDEDGPGLAHDAAEATGGDDSFDAAAPDGRASRGAAAGVVAVAIAAAVGLVSFRGLFLSPAVSGGALLAPSGSLQDMWHAATSPWASEGLGAAAGPDAFAGVLFWLSLITGGNAPAGMVIAYFLALPFAALSMWFALRLVTRVPVFRGVGAVVWALAPVFAVDLAQGRVAPALVHVLLPLLVYALARAVGVRGAVGSAAFAGASGRPSWPAAVVASVVAVPIVAAEPLWLIPLVLGSLVAGLAARRARVLLWVSIPAAVASLPAIVDVFHTPRVLLAQPGLPVTGTPAPLWQAFLGFPQAFDASAGLHGFGWLPAGPWALVVALVCGVPLLAAGVIGLVVPSRRTTWTRVAAGVALVVLVVSAAASRLDATVVGEQSTHYYMGSAISLLWLVMIFATGALREAGRITMPHGLRVTRRPAWFLTVGAMVVALGSAGVWLGPMTANAQDARGSAGAEQGDGLGAALQLHADREAALPATAADRGKGRYQERTLVLGGQEQGFFAAQLVTGDGFHLEELTSRQSAQKLEGPLFTPGASKPATPRGGDRLTREVVATLVSTEPLDPREDLQHLGVGYVAMESTPQNAELAKHMDSVTGLSPVSRGGEARTWLWQVEPLDTSDQVYHESGAVTSRVRVVAEDSTVERLLTNYHGRVTNQSVNQGAGASRWLVLSENFNPGWEATLNGKQLRPVKRDGWAQAFELPEQKGTVNISFHTWWHVPWMLVSGLVILFCLLSLVPMPRGWRTGVRQRPEYRPPYRPAKSTTQTGSSEELKTKPGVAEVEEKQARAQTTQDQEAERD